MDCYRSLYFRLQQVHRLRGQLKLFASLFQCRINHSGQDLRGVSRNAFGLFCHQQILISRHFRTCSHLFCCWRLYPSHLIFRHDLRSSFSAISIPHRGQWASGLCIYFPGTGNPGCGWFFNFFTYGSLRRFDDRSRNRTRIIWMLNCRLHLFGRNFLLRSCGNRRSPRVPGERGKRFTKYGRQVPRFVHGILTYRSRRRRFNRPPIALGGLCHLDFAFVRLLIVTPCRRRRWLVLFFFLFRHIVGVFYRTAAAPIAGRIEFYRLGGHKSGIVHYLGQAGCIQKVSES